MPRFALPIAALLTAATITSAAAPALAADTAGDATARDRQSVVIDDPRGDAPAHIDLLRTSDVVSGSRVSMDLHVRDLTHAGRFRFYLTPTDSVGNSVLVTWHDGHAKARLYFIDYDRDEVDPASCAGLGARWSTRTDRIKVTLPRRCTTLRAGYGPYYFQARSALGSDGDRTASRRAR